MTADGRPRGSVLATGSFIGDSAGGDEHDRGSVWWGGSDMAIMIPDRLPASASQGEKNTFALLQKLPDDCICYYEPVIGERYPDFVVIIPDLGVLIIEVKGWYRGQIERADTRDVTVRQDGLSRTHKHPVRQAREYMFELMNACHANRHASHLINHGGPYAGRFVFPFGHMALMSNITREQVRQADFDVGEAVFGQGKVVMRDEMEALLALPADALVDAMRDWFDPSWTFPRLTASQVDSIRLIIHPEIIIEGTSLAVLDHKQEARARSIGHGHRLVYGVAGSGKTVVLLARARMLAKDASKRVLLLCFNKELARRFREELRGNPNIDAINFHGWVARNGVPLEDDYSPEAEERRAKAFLQLLQAGGGEAGKYDAVLIDEAQDFNPLWFTCAKYALKQPDDGDLLIALDGGQNLYGRKTFTWKSVGVNAQGRVVSRTSYDFDRNYRNTRQILTVAAPFAAVNPSQDEDDALQSYRVDPAFAAREGPEPKSFAAQNRDAEIQAVVNSVQGWLQRGIRSEGDAYEPLGPGDIAILYPRCPAALRPQLYALLEKLSKFSAVRLVSSAATNEARRGTGEGPALTVGTIHSMKGLQFKAVLLIWADLLDGTGEAEWSRGDRALAYVGLTRAQSFLCISWAKGTSLTTEIESAIASLVAEREHGYRPGEDAGGKSLAEPAAAPFRWLR